MFPGTFLALARGDGAAAALVSLSSPLYPGVTLLYAG